MNIYLFIDLHRKRAKEARNYFTNLLKVLCILKILFGESLSINMEVVFGRGRHSKNKVPVLRYVILRQAKKYQDFGYKYKLNKKTAYGSMIIIF
ncbi:Smr/MutS family protein [uncultured Brachyspira sp.]|uniref:Smr/MutS family protein n=1 Tax=uncultured Brachyspira sp. TaxID=221953 RepID=UPI0025F72382|nr:Smr/MutS family protein [uncultured Brachyspira sp.]